MAVLLPVGLSLPRLAPGPGRQGRLAFLCAAFLNVVVGRTVHFLRHRLHARRPVRLTGAAGGRGRALGRARPGPDRARGAHERPARMAGRAGLLGLTVGQALSHRPPGLGRHGGPHRQLPGGSACSCWSSAFSPPCPRKPGSPADAPIRPAARPAARPGPARLRGRAVPGDFASGLDLPGAADGGACNVALPLTCEQLTRDLADLRVFNGAGEVVAHALRRPDPADDRRETRRDLPFFPLTTIDRPARDDLSLRVRRDRDGGAHRGRRPRRREPPPLPTWWTRAAWTPAWTRSNCAGKAAARPCARCRSARATTSPAGPRPRPRCSPTSRPTARPSAAAASCTAACRLSPPGRARLRGPLRPAPGHGCLRRADPAANRLVLTPAGVDSRGPERQVDFSLPARGHGALAAVAAPGRRRCGAGHGAVAAHGERTLADRARKLFYDLSLQGRRLLNDPVVCAPTADRYWQVRLHPDRGGAAAAGQLGLEVGWRPGDLCRLRSRTLYPGLCQPAAGPAQQPRGRPAAGRARRHPLDRPHPAPSNPDRSGCWAARRPCGRCWSPRGPPWCSGRCSSQALPCSA